MKKNSIIKKIFITLLICISFMQVSNASYLNNTNDNSKQTVRSEYATKKPIGKKQLAYKFLMAMLGVAVSSVLIFILLSLYNKFMYSDTTIITNEEDNDFKTPTTLKEAINIFLKKTK